MFPLICLLYFLNRVSWLHEGGVCVMAGRFGETVVCIVEGSVV